MSHTCPDCGSPIENSPEEVRVHRAHCARCGHTLTVLPDRAASAAPSANADEPSAEPSAEPDEEDEELSEPEEETEPPRTAPVFPCPQCGSPLQLTSAGPARIEASCEGCGASVQYLLPAPGGPRREERGPRGGEEGAPRARPCRECGGPLRFTTGPDGLVVGECASCGNRFTLPPRAGPGRGGRPDRGGGYRPGFRRGGGWRSGPPGGRFRGGNRPFRPRRSFDSDDEGTRGRRRRRERDE